MSSVSPELLQVELLATSMSSVSPELLQVELAGDLHEPVVGVRLEQLLRPVQLVVRTVLHDQVDKCVPSLS